MTTLPLYPEGVTTPLTDVEPIECASDCTRCSAGKDRLVVPEAVGDPGGVLVVCDAPTMEEAKAGAWPLSSRSRSWMVSHLRGRGPMAAVYAVRCPTTSTKALAACRAHLAQTLEDVQPERVLAFGPTAQRALLGDTVPSEVSGGYGFLDDGTPVYLLGRLEDASGRRYAMDGLRERVDWALAHEPELPPVRASYHIVRTAVDAERAVTALCSHPWVAFDTETDGVPHSDYWRVNTIAFCGADSDESWVWDVHALADAKLRAPLLEMLANKRMRWVAHNVRFDAKAIRCAWGVNIGGNIHADTLVWAKQLASHASGALADLAPTVGIVGHKEEAARALRKARAKLRAEGGEGVPEDVLASMAAHPKRKIDAWAYGAMDEEVRARYCARDVVSTARLCRRLEATMPQWALDHWAAVIHPGLRAILEVEHAGMPIDMDAVDAMDKKCMATISQLEEIAHDTAGLGTEWELTNPHHLRRVLFDEMGLSPVKSTPSGLASTDEESLREMERTEKDPDGRLLLTYLLEHRRASKIKSTYCDGMRAAEVGGRIYPSLNLTGTETGRLSCSSPNMQNIPRDSEVRNFFRAPFGHVLIDADFSQLELRVAAGLSGDKAMQAIFKEGVDYHQRTAEMISEAAWSLKPEYVTSTHRTAAKAVNFGLLYGQSVPGLAHLISCSTAQAQRIQDAIFGEFRDLHKWIGDRLRHARTHAETWTYWDGKPARRRTLAHIDHWDPKVAANAERCSWNTPVQGTASDHCLHALAAVVDWLREEQLPGRVVLTVHDSIVLEAEDGPHYDIARGVKRIMEAEYCGGVQLAADVKAGVRWGEMEPVTTPGQDMARTLGVFQKKGAKK